MQINNWKTKTYTITNETFDKIQNQPLSQRIKIQNIKLNMQICFLSPKHSIKDLKKKKKKWDEMINVIIKTNV